MADRLIMPQRVSELAPLGSLLKRPRESRIKARFGRTPRALDPTHLDAIRELPCLKCGMEPCGEAAHVRLSSATHGKRNAGGARPDDRWALSLCRSCHLTDDDAQHKVGELQFWGALGINPLMVCEALYRVSPDLVAMRAVVFTFMAGRGDEQKMDGNK